MVAPALIYAGIMAASAIGNSLSAKKQEKAYKQYQAQQQAAAWENYRYQRRAIHNRYAEEVESAQYQQQQIILENLKAQATAKASAASMGITGSTIDNLFKDYDRATAASNYVASRNLYLKKLQSWDEMDAAYIQAKNVGANMQPYTGANWFSALLNGAGTAMSAWASADYQQKQLDIWDRNKVGA